MLSADQIREELVEARNRLDEAAKTIVQDARSKDSARDEALVRQHEGFLDQYSESVGLATRRCIAAFEQWEILEKVPLNEDETFMAAFRTLLREAGDFIATV